MTFNPSKYKLNEFRERLVGRYLKYFVGQIGVGVLTGELVAFYKLTVSGTSFTQKCYLRLAVVYPYKLPRQNVQIKTNE